MNNTTNTIPTMNREQRRALAKKIGKKGRAQAETIGEYARKLTYINLIQKLREINKEKENNNEQTSEK